MNEAVAIPEKAVDKEYIQSIEKGLLVLCAFGPDRPAYTLAEMAKATGLSRAAARRVVLTLQTLGYVGTDGREFFLLPRVLEIGNAYLSSSQLSGLARPYLEELNAQVGEACSLGVLSGREVVYIARAQGHRLMTVSMEIGARLDATCTAMGRVLLAGLPDESLDALLASKPITRYTDLTITSVPELRRKIDLVREQGWALVDQELEIGFCTAAAPVRDLEGHVVAAVSVAMHTSRVPPENAEKGILPFARRAAEAIEGAYQKRLADV